MGRGFRISALLAAAIAVGFVGGRTAMVSDRVAEREVVASRPVVPSPSDRATAPETVATGESAEEPLRRLHQIDRGPVAAEAAARRERLRLLMKLAEADPQIALEYVGDEKRDLKFVLSVWAFYDFPAALAAAHALDGDRDLKSHTGTVLSVLAARAPEAWARHVLAHPEDATAPGRFVKALRELHASDPDLADKVISLLPASVQVRARTAIVEELAERDPLLAADVAAEVSDQGEKSRSVGAILPRLAQVDIDRAAELVHSLDDVTSSYVKSGVAKVAENDADLAFKLARRLWQGSPSEASLTGHSVIAPLFASDPAKAVQLMASWESAEMAGDFLMNGAKWVPVSRCEALGNAVLRSGSDHLIGPFADYVLPTFARAYPEAATEWVTQAAPRGGRAIAGRYAEGLAEGEATFSQLQDAVLAQSSDFLRGEAAFAAARRLVELGRSSEASKLMVHEDIGTRSIDNFADAWARYDPVAAYSWAVGLDDEGRRAQAVDGVARSLQRTDARWLKRLGLE